MTSVKVRGVHGKFMTKEWWSTWYRVWSTVLCFGSWTEGTNSCFFTSVCQPLPLLHSHWSLGGSVFMSMRPGFKRWYRMRSPTFSHSPDACVSSPQTWIAAHREPETCWRPMTSAWSSRSWVEAPAWPAETRNYGRGLKDCWGTETLRRSTAWVWILWPSWRSRWRWQWQLQPAGGERRPEEDCRAWLRPLRSWSRRPSTCTWVPGGRSIK